ncbi:DUF6544 family protein [uncultured Cyclobacterium sp.]|uniref:DUF6920 family protein n=1 Tax=uncultured Cyclobacterium sp. TaxID=453820 RepID=UPI0030EBCE94
MRVAFIVIIALHGVIHLFGFLKAFDLSEFNAISQPISRPMGLLWLITFVLFVVTAFLLAIKLHYWQFTGLAGIVLSQLLILNNWYDAKFGTIINLVILAAIILAFSSFNFKNKVKREVEKIFTDSKANSQALLSEEMLEGLPLIVQKWLHNTGSIGKPMVYCVYLEQDLQMRLKPEQEKWTNAQANQYFSIDPPAFNWYVDLQMNPLLPVVGRDKFEKGEGEMTIKLWSLFSIVNTKKEDKINQASLQRYLAEMVWFPSFAVSPYLKWEAIDNSSAKATMEYKGTIGSGIFHFDERGDFKKFVAMRYKDSKDSIPTEWTVSAIKTEERNGIRIPVSSKAEWKLAHGNWTWLKLEITDIKYNVSEMPLVLD